jgi:hypothetical protein
MVGNLLWVGHISNADTMLGSRVDVDPFVTCTRYADQPTSAQLFDYPPGIRAAKGDYCVSITGLGYDFFFCRTGSLLDKSGSQKVILLLIGGKPW